MEIRIPSFSNMSMFPLKTHFHTNPTKHLLFHPHLSSFSSSSSFSFSLSTCLKNPRFRSVVKANLDSSLVLDTSPDDDDDDDDDDDKYVKEEEEEKNKLVSHIDSDEVVLSVSQRQKRRQEEKAAAAADDDDKIRSAIIGDEAPSPATGSSGGLWGQVKEIVRFAGPATGLWICGPLLGLIDTAVIGQSSSLELAALGPGTVFLDNTSYAFMFLSIATSNMVATALARKDKNLVQHQISMLLFIAFSCGLGMLLVTKFMGTQIISGFIGQKNLHMIPAANTYIQIRGLAWPAILVGMVAQSASLGMKESWGPLRALAVASAVNAFGAVLLCSVFGYGIAGAAWATMLSQVIAAFMMINNLNRTGYSAFVMSVPSPKELLQIFGIAAPVFITMTSKVAFYSLLTYFATSMGTSTIAAHQVMIGVYCMCTVWGEPLSQTAQSFMPEFLYGVHQNLMKARMLLKSLVIIGAIAGLILGLIGTMFPWFLPYTFTSDIAVIREMHSVLIPYFVALSVTPSTHSLEGTLLAARDLKFLSSSMSGCFIFGGLLLLIVSGSGGGLPGCWWALAGFQWARFSLALLRLTSHNGLMLLQ